MTEIDRIATDHAQAAAIAQQGDTFILCGGLVYGPRGVCASAVGGDPNWSDLRELLRRAHAAVSPSPTETPQEVPGRG